MAASTSSDHISTPSDQLHDELIDSVGGRLDVHRRRLDARVTVDDGHASADAALPATVNGGEASRCDVVCD